MRKTIILFLVAVALGAYVYFYEIKGGEARKKEKETAEKLFDFNKDSVDFIEIHSPHGHFIFRKSEDGWLIEQPVKTDADKTPITSLLSNLSSAKKSRTFTVKKADLAQYGLGSGALTVEFKGKNRLQGKVRFGEKTSVGSNVYVNTGDTTVALVPEYIKTGANKSLFDWRDKKALHFKKDQIRQITLTNPKGKFVFEKSGSIWNIRKPFKTKADKSTVEAILNKLDYGRIKEVVAEQTDHLKRFGLNKPAYDISLLSGAEKARLHVAFSKVKENAAYGKDDARPHIFKVDSNFIKPFRKGLFDFRDKNVVEFNKGAADSVVMFYRDSLVSVHKDSTASWRLADGRKVKGWKISNVLSDLKNLKAKKFVSENGLNLKRFGLDKPRGQIQVISKKKVLALLMIGRETGKDLVYAYNPLSQKVVAIERNKRDRLFPKKQDLIEKTKLNTKKVPDK